MPLTFQNSPEKISKTLDWYWNFGVKRIKDHPDYILYRGSWVDDLYRIANTHKPASGERKTLAIWGPSQSGKSTLLSAYLDSEVKSGPNGNYSTALTWNESEPVTFLKGSDGNVSLNPSNAGSDASGCVTRYTAATNVKNPKYPVRLKFNSLSHVMHALAFGYIAECKSAKPDGTDEYWSQEKITKEFIRPQGTIPAGADRSAYELAREILDIVGMFIKSGEKRYSNLNSNWDGLRRDLLNSSDITHSYESAFRFASMIFWDSSQTISGAFRNLKQKLDSLSWANREVYCTMGVAALLLDIDTFKRASDQSDANDSIKKETLRRINSIGFRDENGVILIDEGTSSSEISGSSFGLFQALVREIVVPVKISPSVAEKPFFKLLKDSDILDFPGVALRDSEVNSSTTLDLAAMTENDYRLLTILFKRGKTSSMVMGYANELSIDAFALLVRGQTFPPKPEQLTKGIQYWWQKINPNFSPDTNFNVSPPLPLSVCLTFFGNVLKELGSTKPKSGPSPVFKDMLDLLTPLNRPANASYFTTSYRKFPAGMFDSNNEEVKWAVQAIKDNPDFQRIFNSSESKESFNHLISDEDGGVEYFLASQLEKVKMSSRLIHLEALNNSNIKDGQELLNIALPQIEDVGARQLKLISDVTRAINDNLKAWEKKIPSELSRYSEIEDCTSLYSYLIRSLIAVESNDLEDIPLNFALTNREFKHNYVMSQWSRWRESSINRMKKIHGFNWSHIGLRDETDARMLLQIISEGRQLEMDLIRWISDEIGYLTSETISRILRSELAVVMGNILREGALKPKAKNRFEDTLVSMKIQVNWENGSGSNTDSPHYKKVITPFIENLSSIKLVTPIRPNLPGDAELKTIWN
jgi:hypothetical protein